MTILEASKEGKPKKRKGIRDFPVYDKNPAWSNLIIKTRDKTVSMSKRGIDLYDPDTGAQAETAFMGVRKRVDRGEFIKIFQETAKILAGLDHHGGKIFWYVMHATRMNDDSIYFDAEECMEFVGYNSKNSVWLGLIDLLNKEVLFKCRKQNVYFINPTFLFNGDRLVTWNDYVVKGTKIDKDLQEAEKKAIMEKYQLPLFNPEPTKQNGPLTDEH